MAVRGKRDGGKERFWRETFRQWRRSGQGVRAFCAEHELTESLFHAWRRILAERDQAATASGNVPTFVPVRVIDPAAPTALEVALERGCVVRVARGFDADSLRQLLAILVSPTGGRHVCVSQVGRRDEFVRRQSQGTWPSREVENRVYGYK
jgi:hypothetical protein